MRSVAESISAVRRNAGVLDQVDYRLARSPEEKEEIYRLRYRAYLQEGAVKPTAEECVMDQYDDLPNSWTFGVFIQDELYGSLRISILTSEWRLSCSAEVFGELLHPRLDRGQVIVDPARFVADPAKARRFSELPYVTLRLAYMACEYFDADLALAIVRPEHQAFYRRVFLHETIAEPRFLPGLLKPVGLMAADFPTLREKVFERYPIMHSSAFERRMLFERPAERRQGLGDVLVSPLEPTSIALQS
jgi:N-acyl-L-homoserine lactone synthetase